MKMAQDSILENLVKMMAELKTTFSDFQGAIVELRSDLEYEISKRICDVKLDVDSHRKELFEVQSAVTGIVEKCSSDMKDIREQLSNIKAGDRKIDSVRQISGASVSSDKQLEVDNECTAEPSRLVKPPKFDGSSPWAVFHRQFKTAAQYNQWEEDEKNAQLVTALQGPAADILQTVPMEATYREICVRLWRVAMESTIWLLYTSVNCVGGNRRQERLFKILL
ncbi:uncharacterized protein LOC120356563 [Nilaparvata lugens]|uniref:uncharacterized protein LOC120356563 n=1 Tax=Nilaparvata lugens TaxID=108931 RepID=UPI00193D2CE0|nr:uncharacterized protein LOC120356563 [Nilaparvata lugens]